MLIYSFSDVYLSQNDVIIHNHDYVKISDIGFTENTALICNTNRPLINNVNTRHSGGDWYGPSGTRVGGMGSDDVPGFVRTRGPMVVRLLRNTATDPPSEGIYHCVVEDNTMREHTLYVGLYNSENGRLVFTCTCDIFCIHFFQEMSEYLTRYISLCILLSMKLVIRSPSPVSPPMDLLPLSLGLETMQR